MNKVTRKIIIVVITLVIIFSVAVIIGAFIPASVLAPISIVPTLTPDTPISPIAQCIVTGCSSQVCADQDVITTCEFRPEFDCYRAAQCERQADNQCGWTMTSELQACLASRLGNN